MALSNNPSLQEILWNFSRFKDEKRRLTLKDNPHFYEKLPTTPEEYGDDVQIDSTESFRYCNEFYVLTDEPKLVHIMTDQDWQFFGNFWCPKNAIIFKGFEGVFLSFFTLFLMDFQTFVGGSRGKKSLRHLLEAHAVDSANSSRRPPLR